MASPAEIHNRLAAAWNRRDFAATRALMHPDYIHMDAANEETIGPDAGIRITQVYAAAFPDGAMNVTRVFTEADTAIAEVVATGTHRGELKGIAPAGKRIEIPICDVIEVRDGKAYREREYFDMMSMMVQPGVVKMKGAARVSA